MSDSPKCAFSLSLGKMDIGRIPPFATLASLSSGARTSASLCSLPEAYRSDSMNRMNEIAAQRLRLRDFMSEDRGELTVVLRHAQDTAKNGDFPAGQTERVDLAIVEHIQFPFKAVALAKMDLAL